MTTKRGVNLGCGHVILPCARPTHHELIPDFLYRSPDIKWDNVDWNTGEGVSHVVDLFDYPWDLPDDTYDYAIAAHIVEHIPHHIVERGAFMARHQQYQDGWFYWFSELNRVLKPGGRAFVLAPYAWSNGGISDPTHTRYVTPASFNYLVRNDESPFEYRQTARWTEIDFQRDFSWTPHVIGARRIRDTMQAIGAVNTLWTHGTVGVDADWSERVPDDDYSQRVFHGMTWEQAQAQINAIADIMVVLTKASDDEDHS